MNPIKDVTLDKTGKERLINGINTFADAVSATLGYRGRNVLIETAGGRVRVSKDGYSVSEEIFLDDPIESLGCKFMKEACRKVHSIAGDSTTTVAILAQALIKYSHEEVEKGRSPIDVKHEMEASREKVIEYIKSKSLPLTPERMYAVAHTSAQSDDEIATIVKNAFEQAGEFGVVTHTRSETEETYLDAIDGTLCESGYENEIFVNKFDSNTVEYVNPHVIVSEIEFQSMNQMMPFFEAALNPADKRPLVIIGSIRFEALNTLKKNFLEKKIDAVVINPPSHGSKRKDYLDDLALVLGTNMISAVSGASFIGRAKEFIGVCESIKISENDTIIIPSKSVNRERVDAKINEIKERIEKSTNDAEVQYLSDRVAKLSGKTSIIKVGANIESELNEKIDRVDDSVRAVRSAKEGGVLAGGGVALMNAIVDLELDYVTKNSLNIPIKKILSNSGIILSDIKWSEFKGDYTKTEYIGYDVKDYQIKDMVEAGILDTAKAVITAYDHAVSVAGTILLTSPIITYKREK